MLLTSYDRLLRYLAGAQNGNLEDSAENKRDIIAWIPSVSKKIERYLKRNLLIKSRVEYFDNDNNRQFFVNAPRIISITSVKYDSTGLFTGGEIELATTSYKIGVDGKTVVIDWGEISNGYKTLQIVYIGGLAYTGVLSTYATGDTTNMTVGNFVIGSESMAVGIVKATATDSLQVEVLYGVFEDGETLTESTTESITGTTGETIVLTSKTTECLAESHPEITTACEMEIRFLQVHKRDYENTGTNKDGTTIRRGANQKPRYNMQPEAVDLLSSYRLAVL